MQVVFGIAIRFYGPSTAQVAYWWAVVVSLPARALTSIAHGLATGAQQANMAVQEVAEGVLVTVRGLAQPVVAVATGAASGARAVAYGFSTGLTVLQVTMGSLSNSVLTLAASMALEAAGSLPMVRHSIVVWESRRGGAPYNDLPTHNLSDVSSLSAVAMLFQCLRVAAFVGIRLGIAVAGHVCLEAVESPGPAALLVRAPVLAITAGPANVLPDPGLPAPEASPACEVVAAVEIVKQPGEEVVAVEGACGAPEASFSQASPVTEATEVESCAAPAQPAAQEENSLPPTTTTTTTTTDATTTDATTTTTDATDASLPSASPSSVYVTLTGRWLDVVEPS